MSHFAGLDQDNKVIRVLVGDNNEPDEGAAFVNALGGTWVKTSYNANIRKNFAGIGMTYDADRDAFIPVSCHAEAILKEDTCRWECANVEHEAAIK